MAFGAGDAESPFSNNLGASSVVNLKFRARGGVSSLPDNSVDTVAHWMSIMIMSNTMSRLICLVLAVALSVVVLTGCTVSGPAAVNSLALVEVSGAIVRAGGPIVQDLSHPKSSPMTSTAVVYRATSSQSSISGTPVLKVRTSASTGGRFTLHLVPGNYFLVAETASGVMISAPKRITLGAGGVPSIKLTVSVP
jgi:hypothetical protein